MLFRSQPGDVASAGRTEGDEGHRGSISTSARIESRVSTEQECSGAGRLEGTSASGEGGFERDELFASDPWAGGTSHRRKDVGSEHKEPEDVWRAWRERGLPGQHAIESCGGSAEVDVCHSDLCRIVDVVTNEALRLLMNEVRAVGDCHTFEPLQFYEHESDIQDVEENAAESSESWLGHLQKHSELLLVFEGEWERFERVVRMEAAVLASCVGHGEEGWWNDTLQLAERVQGFANTFGISQTHWDSEQVVEAVARETEQEDERDVLGIEARKILVETGQMGKIGRAHV